MAAKASSSPQPAGLRWYWQVAVVCAAIALIFSRQPDAFLHAQFFAEDGKIWFADAYNNGWFTSLFKAQDGYFQTLPRLAAALSLPAPLALAVFDLLARNQPAPLGETTALQVLSRNVPGQDDERLELQQRMIELASGR